MSVPPSGQSPSTPPEKGNGPGEGKRKSKRDFNLPGKKGKEEEGKKKGLFDFGGEPGAKEIKQSVDQQQMGEMQKAGALQGAEAKATVNSVGQLVQRLVTQMKVGENFASMNLTNSTEVPEAFAGSNLTLSYQENALVIHFDNFMTPQQENNAFMLVEKNNEQLVQMVQALQAKNINISELSIGNHMVTLPRVEALPPPFQPPPSAETREEQQRQERQDGEEGAGPE